MPHLTPVAARLAVPVLLTGVLLTAGCGTPPDLDQPQSLPQRPSPSLTATPSPTPSALPTGPPATVTPTDQGTVARDCQGRPTGAQVIAVLRKSNLIGNSTAATVAQAPVCAASWQYTVIQVSGREPLQVVTKGEPGSLTLVTAGTDVCSIPVRTAAPPGIRSLACS